MNLALAFARVLFISLSVFFMTLYMVSGSEGATPLRMGIGVGIGLLFSGLLLGFDQLFRKFNLRSLNVAILGLFVGYLMGQALVLILGAVLEISANALHLTPQMLDIIKIALFLFGVYTGTLMTIRSADEIYISIPFVRFSATAHKKKDLVIDPSVLMDARIIDMSASGLLDNHLILPRFVVKELYSQSEVGDELTRNKAKRALDVVKKLETSHGLELRYSDTDFPDIKEPTGKLIRLARLLEANILTADISRIQTSSIEGIRFVNMHSLSNSLKPLMQAGEHIKIKIQRFGKEPRQGVGYLEDGTMVVVNGGGDYIGETIDAQVLSVKHTSSGRMIFCNALDEEGEYSDYDDHEDR